ncbi:dihydrolipoamide acetyltransferase component of pyruvate dehydrogenase complex [Brevibacillus reuszeri]|uniref:Dihydrolipoamide acetyltransferase component of pyruvate dehydrogenase complex n=1 Tax=Brevibacillus reuszeri TaxID=54915 RepID=A0A0K9YP17_9BACL|nr:dihydrolipoamide acetyltransferase family protein [Brevibacillus reuszeri]KNB70416.1 2-oxoglutarate dehydrogenase [Brevibacillus reuszeri]MED1857950.1 dihydrolipoamide acetyltransferase family protein [Brevibacillus reuszeri]GED71825.1 dihydrolipoamide acetyltransferase component of pyruvate dehydrogenase complex [Brevibacillus reuszeri]
MVEFKLPDVGEGMHEGEILRVLVKTGEFVQMDQPILEVQTDKVNAELSAPASGVITEIFYTEGDTVHVGTTLLTIDNGTKTEESTTISASEDVKQIERKEEEPVAPAPAGQAIKRVLATPFVRQMAREMKIDIEHVQGTGPIGRVTEEDLRRFTQGANAKPSKSTIAEQPVQTAHSPVKSSLPTNQNREERIVLKGIRKKIAEHMVKSVTTIPHVTSVDEFEMDELKAVRERVKPFAEKKGVKLTFLPFFIKALVLALREFPMLNSSLDEETNEIVLKHYYHIGIATDTPQGLIVPVIKDVDQKSIFELAREISSLAQLARDGKLTMDQITGGTFTISNVGAIGGLQATPIINHPEAAILSLHKMEKRWVVREDEGVIRWMMNTSLSFDHRLIDGVTAVKFTNRIKELIEEPNLLFAEMI